MWFLAYNKLQDWHNKGAAADACTSASHYEGNIPITHWQLYTDHKNIPLTTRIYGGSLGNMEFVVSILSQFANKWVETFWPSIKVLPGKGLKYTFWPQICLWATQHCVVGQVGWHINGMHVMVSSQRQVFINNTNLFILYIRLHVLLAVKSLSSYSFTHTHARTHTHTHTTHTYTLTSQIYYKGG